MKKLLTTLMVSALVIACIFALSTDANAATVASGTCGDNLTWTLDDAGTLTISGSGAMKNYSSASSVPWYSNRSSIKNVSIGDSVTTIGNYAFYKCTSLTSITVPDSVTTIGDYAFYYCDSLTSVTIGDSVTTIGKGVFFDCDSLTSVTIGDSVTTIGYNAFQYCTSLNSVYITDVAAWCEIDFGYSYANPLYYANNLYLDGVLVKELVIPDSVTTIGNYAFYSCDSLTSVTIGDNVTTIGNYAFYSCDSLTSVSIPDNVTTIGNDAFYSCDSLTSVTVGDGVTTIGERAFHFCDSLTDVYITDPDTWCNIQFGDNPMDHADRLHILDEAGNEVTEVVLDNTVTTIPSYAFLKCDSLTSITIPNSVTTVGDWAFAYCNNLTDVYYEGDRYQWDKISIGSHNSALTGATIHFAEHIHDYSTIPPVTVTATCTEEGYTNVTCFVCGTKEKIDIAPLGHDAVPIPAVAPTCTETGLTEGSSCARCQTVLVKQTEVSALGHDAVPIPAVAPTCTETGLTEGSCCQRCESVLVEQTVVPTIAHSTPNGLCENCGAYTCGEKLSWTLNAVGTLTVSGTGPMWNFSSTSDTPWYSQRHRITCVIIESGATTIGENAFASCDSLFWVSIPDTVTAIGAYAFRSCNSLTSVTVPASVTTIGDHAFDNCTKLTAITVGDSVTTISDSAFFFCDSLESIYYTGTKDRWNQISIGSYNSALTNATVYYNHVHDYSLAPSVTVPATCTEAGYVEYTCVYGEKHRETLPALSHSYTGSEVEVAPTCTEEGYSGILCIRCDSVEKSDIVPELGHKMVLAPAMDPTCTETGLTAGTCCERCQLVGIAQDEVPATGHSFAEGACTVCGAPECTPGDLDGNVAVDEDDVIYLLQHLLMPEDYSVGQTVDYDNSGEFDEDDVIYLLQYLLMPDAFPL